MAVVAVYCPRCCPVCAAKPSPAPVTPLAGEKPAEGATQQKDDGWGAMLLVRMAHELLTPFSGEVQCNDDFRDVFHAKFARTLYWGGFSTFL